MEKILCLLYNWSYSFCYLSGIETDEDTEKIICKELDVEIHKLEDKITLYYNNNEVKVKQNSAIQRNICKKLEQIFDEKELYEPL